MFGRKRQKIALFLHNHIVQRLLQKISLKLFYIIILWLYFEDIEFFRTEDVIYAREIDHYINTHAHNLNQLYIDSVSLLS